MNAKSMLDFTQKMIEEFGTRITGTESSRKISGFIKSELEKYCDKTSTDEFDIHPGSFTNLGRVYAITYIFGTMLLFIPGFPVYLSSMIFIWGYIYSTIQFGILEDSFDIFFRKKKGYNVFGTLEPAGDVKQQIIVSGHYDSPYVLSFLNHFQKLYGIRLLLSISLYFVALLVSCAYTAFQVFDIPQPGFLITVRYILLFGFIFAIPMYYFISKKKSPGAGDNLIAVSLVLKLAELFSNDKRSGKPLNKTRLLFLTPDAEEIGLRGSRAFVKKHSSELHSLNTYVLNIDSLFKYRDLTVLTTDKNGTVKLSGEMAKEIKTIAGDLGYSVQIKALPFGGGGTDAASFARAGIKAGSIIGISTDYIRDGLVYHTLEDKVENIEPEIVDACFNIIVKYIRKKDSK
jgi:aminopeptidase YwaD